jgi:hypothetical protein
VSAASQPATLTLPAIAHGEVWPGQGGRFICALPALLGMPARALIAAESDSEPLAFGPHVDLARNSSQIDGMANTQVLLAAKDKHPAAEFAAAYTADGHNDFFLPSRLDTVMAYTCAPHHFERSGFYWTSSQFSSNGAFVMGFELGNSYCDSQHAEFRVRAFRWVELSDLSSGPCLLSGSSRPAITTGAQAGPPALPAIGHGELWPGQGGHFICTLPALLGMPARALIAAGTDSGNLPFGPHMDTGLASSHVDGMANTQALLAAEGEHPAAEFAAACTADGHTDFFLPSRLDMVMAYICAAHLFEITFCWYWTSTQASRGSTFITSFNTGNSYDNPEGQYRVRAFRWVRLDA